MLDTETKRRINTARDILVGKVPDPKSQVEQITIALIYKFMDDMDREAAELGGERTFFNGEFEAYAWSTLLSPALGGHEVLNLYSDAIQKMNQNPNIPQLFRDIFKNAFLPYRDPETLKSFLKIINEFSYDHSEKLGDAFEYLLSVLGSQGDAGQFRTPRHIIDFIVDVVNPQKQERILDVACGTAGFLISAFKHIVKQNSSNFDPDANTKAFEKSGVPLQEVTLNSTRYKGDLLTPDDRTRLAENIHGYDISPDMVRLSLVNMYLHSISDPKIDEYDTLTSDDRWNEYFDVILANPPFMSPKGGIRPHNRFSVTSKRSEVLFVDYIAEHLTPRGRAGVIVPEGIIFQSQNAYKQLREMLVKNHLVAVVSLPAGVFNPYSGVKTSILLLDKQLNKKTKNILFVKINNDGFDLGAQRRPMQKNDLPEAARLIKTYVETLRTGADFSVESFAALTPLLVEKERLAEGGEFNLSGERYRVDTRIRKAIECEFVKLGEYVDFISGLTLSIPKSQKKGGVPIISMNSITKDGQIVHDGIREIELPKKKNIAFLKEGDLLFNWRNGSRHLVGKTGYFQFDGKYVFASFLIGIRTKKDLLSKFLWHLLNFYRREGKYQAFMRQNVNGLFNREELKILEIPLPALDIQREIVAEIEGYQKIIDGARQVVEFYKPQITIDPEWEMVEIKSICEKITKGSSPKWQGIDYTDAKNGILFITSENVGSGELLLNKRKYVEKKFNDIEKKSILQKGDVLTNIVGASIGRTAIFGLEEIANINQAVCILQPNSSKVLSKYLMNYMNNDVFLTSLLGSKVENARANVSMSVLGDLKIPLPDLPTQERIVAQIEREQALVNANKELIKLYEAKIKERITRVWGA